MTNLDLTVPFLAAPKRIDAYLASALAGTFSRNEVKVFLENGQIRLNGKSAKPSVLLKEGDRIEGRLTPRQAAPMMPESIPLNVIHEDESLLVVDKPAGMVVHPGAGNRTGTLAQALLGLRGKLSTLGGSERPGIVHRLDRDTSGLLIVAKDNRTHRALQSQFESRSLSKIYTALVWGRVDFEEGHVDRPLARHPSIRTKMAVREGPEAKEAKTRYWVLRRFPKTTLLGVKILTGRTHQIRVHLAHLGHPVVGDRVYGRDRRSSARLALHASKIEFVHPKTGKLVRFESPLPRDFEALIEKEASIKDEN